MSGWADGALAGQYPGPALGAPHSAGLFLGDDFTQAYTTGWAATTIGGSAPTYSIVAPGGYTEHGIHRTTTAAASGTGGVILRAATADLYRVPPPGSRWVVKVRTSASASYEFWSGFVSSAGLVRTADATQLIGIRTDRAVDGNIYGIVKDGAAAGNENTVDLGVTAEASNWEAVGFDVEGDTTTPSIQFYVYDLTSRGAWMRQPIGDPITTNIPAGPLFSCALGVVSRAVAAKAVDIDFWNLGGRAPRL